MKTRASITSRLLAILAVLSSVLITGCSDTDWDGFYDFVEAWAWNNAIWDGENLDYGKLTAELADDAVDQVVGGEHQTALEVDQVVDDIRKADELAEQAQLDGSLPQMEEAIRLRPDDWSYRQGKAVMLLSNSDLNGYQASMEDAYDRVQKAINSGTDCRVAHRNYYEHQVQALRLASDEVVGTEIIIQEKADAELWLEHPEDWPCP